MELSDVGIYQAALDSVSYVRNRLPAALQTPQIGIICGSGLGGLAAAISSDLDKVEIDYNDIPFFPKSTVQGHAGKLLFGFMGKSGQAVVLMVGRLHYYEGHSMQETTYPIRVLHLLGVTNLIVTNAAGGLNDKYKVGDLMILNDHINLVGLAGAHPLRGPNIEQFGTRFPPLSDAYNLEFRRRAHRAWKNLKSGTDSVQRSVHEGVYAFVMGPSYETRAECRMLRSMGADVVGMSTVSEVIVARHCGMRVLAISLVTNLAVLEPGPRGDELAIAEHDEKSLAEMHASGKANHEEVLQSGLSAASDMQLLVFDIVESLAGGA